MSRKDVQQCMELMEYLKTMWPDFEITVDDLLSASPNSVLNVYEHLLSNLQIDLPRISQELIANTSERDLYSDIASPLAVYLCTKQIFHRLGHVRALGLHDVLAPTPVKNRHNITQVLNFLSYAQETSNRIYPIQVQVHDDAHNAAQNLSKINELKKQLHELTMKNAASQAEIAAVEKQTQEVKLSMQGHDRQLQQLEEREHEIEKKYAAPKNKQKQLIIQLEQKLQRRNELKSQIVDNSETIILEEQTLKDQIVQAKSEDNSLALHISDISTSVAYFKNVIDKHRIVNSNKNMPDFLNHFERNQNVRKSLEEAEQQHKEQLELQKVKSTANAAADRNTAELEKQLQSIQLKHAARKTDLLQEITNLETELQIVSKKNASILKEEQQLDKKIEAGRKKLAECSSEMADIVEYFNQKNQAILEAHGLFETCANKKINEIIELIKKSKAT